ncbi:Pre-mRNA-splicing factor CLF1 [Wickerhamiella sorbophila]|uniref:Pre-mRNA-splicing factor CLF1 n=1 Tax=Wickerhamiella sorbophila TaxID=45607 RepID=A0A2T0FNR9_9ASCO|nr:Pre-mRNA-splicing factor CLF1 [Wickerhamiella sorbophila]PRT56627.1 Pre-mRNA-splicing factor CLF1 [Wickerhamiella sorbophila]
MSEVKNRAVAPLQISAEQILAEAFERKEKVLTKAYETVTDKAELRELQHRKRTEWEEALRRNRLDLRQWMRYAQFEWDQKEYERGRSIFERALAVDHTFVPLWIRYIQSELRAGNVNHARNILDRATETLPKVDKLWFTYVGMEEMLNNLGGCRQVFEKWLQWKPELYAWTAYIGFEVRHKQTQRARELYRRLVSERPDPENWVQWAKFEDVSRGDVRGVYTLAIDSLMSLRGPQAIPEMLLLEFAKWEADKKEWDRARAIFKFGLKHLPPRNAHNLRSGYVLLEKQFGNADSLEWSICLHRRSLLEEHLLDNPASMDTWWDLLSLVQASGSADDLREVFERAVANVPADLTKTDQWRRYIYIWLRYAFYEEEMAEIDRAREVYIMALKTLPHHLFSSAKLWKHFSYFEIRQGDVGAARKIFGQAIGRTAKPKVYKEYIALELQLREIDRCRKLYELFIEKYPGLAATWIDYASLEDELDDLERARGIYELAIEQPEMDKLDLIWKSYAEFEASNDNLDRARSVYERLLQRVSHAKVWIARAMLEIGENGENVEQAREVFIRADRELAETPSQRVSLYDARVQFERIYGNEETLQQMEKAAPQAVEKRRQLEDGNHEYYVDYVFPNSTEKVSKLLANAKKWAASRDQ